MRTPGPWTWDEQDGYVIGPPGAGVVAYDVGHDEDGRLIAAAPELLEALEECAGLLVDEWEGTRGLISPGKEAIENAWAAIAKARGEVKAPAPS